MSVPDLLRRISVQKHLGRILQRGSPFRKSDLPDAIEDLAVPLWWFPDAEGFRDVGNFAVMPADQNNLARERQIVEDGVDHLCDLLIRVRKVIVDRQIQSGGQRRNRLDGAFAVL